MILAYVLQNTSSFDKLHKWNHSLHLCIQFNLHIYIINLNILYVFILSRKYKEKIQLGMCPSQKCIHHDVIGCDYSKKKRWMDSWCNWWWKTRRSGYNKGSHRDFMTYTYMGCTF